MQRHLQLHIRIIRYTLYGIFRMVRTVTLLLALKRRDSSVTVSRAVYEYALPR